jgi:hypothetical protein
VTLERCELCQIDPSRILMDPFGQVWNNIGKNKTEEVLADSRETRFTCQLVVNDPYPH